jgi:ADP-heptose:LPS heptosyltransferase
MSQRPRLAVNIGCGPRWPKKMLSARGIAEYVRAVGARLDIDVLLVGGPEEASKVESVFAALGSRTSVRSALTCSSVQEFIALLDQVDVVFCGDTLAVHVASAIGLPAVCVFGPTSAAEIPDFDGLISKAWSQGLECLCCYGDCAKTDNCMSLLDIDHLVELTRRQVLRGRPGR